MGGSLIFVIVFIIIGVFFFSFNNKKPKHRYPDSYYEAKLKKIIILGDSDDLVVKWVREHKDYVSERINGLGPSFKPSREDATNPYLWKDGHWKWWIENYKIKY